MALITVKHLEKFAAALAGKIADLFVAKEEGKGLVAVDDELSGTSANPVQNRVVSGALDAKVPASRKVNGKALDKDISLSAPDVGAIPASLKGVGGGVAELGTDGKVPAAQLPSYVDDVVEGYLHDGGLYADPGHGSAIPGESGKIYVDVPSGKTYRWSGMAFVVISETIALGETASTAHRGDHGREAYEHSQAAHAPADAQRNVQADWEATDEGSDSYIRNKPRIPSVEVATDEDIDSVISGLFE